MQRTFKNHQSNDGCSKFFNLKPNAGSENKLQYQHAKIGKIFWKQVTAARTSKDLAVVKKQNKKVYGKCIAKYIFSKWEISLVHYKRGYSGPGMLGEFVVVLLMWFLGAPSILIFYATVHTQEFIWVFQGNICKWLHMFG